MKDDSGSYAVLTEQGSSAPQMTAAEIMDIISRLPGCDGQEADAVSAYTQVKMEDAHKLLRIPKKGVSRHLDASTPTEKAIAWYTWSLCVGTPEQETMLKNAKNEQWLRDTTVAGLGAVPSRFWWTLILLHISLAVRSAVDIR